MQTIVNALRSLLGNPNFYVQMQGYNNYQWDYGAMLEYCIAGIILMIVVSSVFKFLRVLIGGK